jgi:hypothetical protein
MLSNYSLVFESGTLTVMRAPLVIKATDATRIVGAPNPSNHGETLTVSCGRCERLRTANLAA